ncbi:MAG: DUF3368 domain-containing protein [Hormoscilla sp. GM7CHS1pb]|nr:DUF3368 domain-containing protein [Hormoscilla sp. GM7CHS1pb]
MKAVTNSSVLIALSTIGQLSLLHQRFPEGLLLPQAVWREVASALWLTRRAITNDALVTLLRMELDEGEAEAIALYLEEPVEAILLDEKNARKVARRMGLPVLGTLGVLIWAKKNGLIPSLREQLDALRLGKFRLSQLVYQEALNKVGE